MPTKQIDFERAFDYTETSEDLRARYENIKHLCGVLVQDVYSGPYYLLETEKHADETVTTKPLGTIKEPIVAYVACWGNGGVAIIDSPLWDIVRKEVDAIVEDLPTYYMPDCDYRSFAEPEAGWYEDSDGERCDENAEGAQWVDNDESYYHVGRERWFEFFFTPKTAEYFL